MLGACPIDKLRLAPAPNGPSGRETSARDKRRWLFDCVVVLAVSRALAALAEFSPLFPLSLSPVQSRSLTRRLARFSRWLARRRPPSLGSFRSEQTVYNKATGEQEAQRALCKRSELLVRARDSCRRSSAVFPLDGYGMLLLFCRCCFCSSAAAALFLLPIFSSQHSLAPSGQVGAARRRVVAPTRPAHCAESSRGSSADQWAVWAPMSMVSGEQEELEKRGRKIGQK